MTYIVIEGPIGVGKTSLAKLLAKKQGWPVDLEDVDTDRVKLMLGKFYADREQYAFQTEVFFLLNRYRQQEAVVKPALAGGDGHSLVGDYLFAKTRLFAGLNLRGAELSLFDEIYEALSRQVAAPDLVVYLTASVDTLMSRIYQRDRSIERAMQREYIADLARLYDSFFGGYHDTPLVRIDTDSLDFMRSANALQEVVSAILHAAGVGSLRSG